MNRDPIGYGGSQWNLYEYVRGRVTTFGDPSGLVFPGQGGPGGPYFKPVGPAYGPIDGIIWFFYGSFDTHMDAFVGSRCKYRCPNLTCSGSARDQIVIDGDQDWSDGNKDAEAYGRSIGADKERIGLMQSALRHCYFSARVASQQSCSCSQCLVDTRDLWQHYLQPGLKQGVWDTARAIFNDQEGRECAGCSGDKALQDAGRWVDFPENSGTSVFIRGPKPGTRECCRNKLRNKELFWQREGDKGPLILPPVPPFETL